MVKRYTFIQAGQCWDIGSFQTHSMYAKNTSYKGKEIQTGRCKTDRQSGKLIRIPTFKIMLNDAEGTRSRLLHILSKEKGQMYQGENHFSPAPKGTKASWGQLLRKHEGMMRVIPVTGWKKNCFGEHSGIINIYQWEDQGTYDSSEGQKY